MEQVVRGRGVPSSGTGKGLRRLGRVVSNSRFLLLPERQRHPNLASRVLALALKRLNADWQERWGHPVVLVESCVDESKCRGTCYRACGFEAVGLIAGYGRSSRARAAHYATQGIIRQSACA